MGTRDKIKLAVALTVTTAAAVVLIIGVAQHLDRGGNRHEFSNADEDRLLATCLTVTDDRPDVGIRCPTAVRTLIEAAEEQGCDYSDAASILAAVLEGIDLPADWCVS